MNTVGVISEAKMDAFYIEWKIPECVLLPTPAFYCSPNFLFSECDWYLSLDLHDNAAIISLNLKAQFPVNVKTVTVSANIKKADGSLEKTEENLTCTLPNYGSFFVQRNLWQVQLMALDDLQKRKSELAPSGVLTLSLRIWSSYPPPAISPNMPLTTVPNVPPATNIQELLKLMELETLSSDFNELLSNGENCDATLKVKDKEFQVHRTILTARSSVFSAMFKSTMSEQETGVVDVPDCDPESFGDFLKYLYTGKLEDISCQTAEHLYVTADKYNVQKLKSFCVRFIKESLSVEDFCHVVALAELYDEEEWMCSAQKFFNENAAKIVSTSEWEALMKNNYRLANKLLKGMLNCKV